VIVCGTGHRPNKLGGYSKPVFESLVSTAKVWLQANLLDGDVVISGVALGWDQALAVAAIRLKIEVHAYVPCAGHSKQWPEESQRLYKRILQKCSEVRLIHPGDYIPACMQWRNEAMVDASDAVLALWDGSSGGTGNCIKYAKKKKKDIINLWEIHNFEV